MAKTTLGVDNFSKPAPRWYRITKKILYTIAGSSIVTGTLQRFGVSDADCLLIMGWLVLIGELMGSVLANGEVYSSTENANDSLDYIYYENKNSFPATGVDGTVYYDAATDTDWVWNGRTYVLLTGDRPQKPPRLP